MAGLWSLRVTSATRLMAQRTVLTAMLAILPACSQIALQDNSQPMNPQPSYASLAAKYLLSVLKDARTYDGFEISSPRWVSTLKGWSWLACVRYHDHGHARIYAIFIQDNSVSDGRYAVETDGCDGQSYTPFDLISGELGRSTAPLQQPIY